MFSGLFHLVRLSLEKHISGHSTVNTTTKGSPKGSVLTVQASLHKPSEES